MANPLLRPVDEFVGTIAPVLVGLAGELRVQSEKLPADVALEAFNVAAAVMDSDGTLTDDELWAFIGVFARRFDTVARAASPMGLRLAGLLGGKRTFVDHPSALFALLLRADAARGTTHTWDYHRLALDIATAVVSLSPVASHAELAAVERFRSTLLAAMDGAGVPRPGSAPATTSPTPGPGVLEATDAQPETPEPPEPPRPLEELLAELDELVGLAAVKAEVKLVADLIRVQKLRQERGLPVVDQSRHLVFTGNPGTGKTTVARLIAQIYRTLGVVDKGHLIETDRAGLVAGYVGQTSIKVKEVFKAAMGGVLLIDEAHALVRGNERDFGHEAIDMIVKYMEDHRGDVVLIVAGYPEEMTEFLDANPGLRSRFPKTIYFEDYSDAELLGIFDLMCAKNHYSPTPDARDRVLAYLASQPRTHGFGNGRVVRNLFEAAVARHASRVVDEAEPSDDVLVTLEAADIPAAAS